VRRALAALCASTCLAVPAAAGAAGAAGAADVATRAVHAGARTIGYRSIGTGRPIVLIQGLAGTIDGWPPSFLDAIASGGHRVVVFDNEGIGRSTMAAGTLTIARMADDTAALIGALGLKRPDVAGWSMGGMIAQSFAVRHPRSRRRLVLLATAPGDGRAVPPAPDALALLSSGDAAGLLGELFPPDRTAARDLYVADILRRKGFSGVAPAPVIGAQLAASATWIGGGDPDGRRVSRLRLRTLVGGGGKDRLLPVGNQRHLAKLIPHARLVTYADAAHGFFFQHQRDFVKRMTSFLRP
jgi:pimeloyl-ACP methyl ester carboxylesterase